MVQYSMSILTFGEVNMNKPFIAIEGPIGVGKSHLHTSSVRRLTIMKNEKLLTKIHFSQIFMTILKNGVSKLKCSFCVIDINKLEILKR